MNKKLLKLGCSNLKRDSTDLLPALDMYDGASYGVIRKFLRDYQWAEQVSIAVLLYRVNCDDTLRAIRDWI